jgi:proline iminopeptidase
VSTISRVVASKRQPDDDRATTRSRTGALAAVVVVLLWAAAAAWWTPRGPVTTVQALVTLAVSLGVGGLAGWAMRSRWALAVAPLAFAALFEVLRLGHDGPTVDGPHWSTYGVLAFAVGRGFHALVTLVPMLFGAAIGAGVARRRIGMPHDGPDGRRAGVFLRRGVAALTALGLVVLAAALARPAGTDPITGSAGQPVPGSIAELSRVEISGHDLSMMIRGERDVNPVLLYLAGGPGGTELGAMRHHGRDLERDFIVATWDQRGSGRSYGELEPTSTLTLDRAVRDTIEVAEYLRERFAQDRVYLVGQSWGSLLGVLAAQRRPDLFAAFVGVGQMVSPRETDQIFYRDTLAWAERTGQTELAATLRENGPPPYADALAYEPALSHEMDVSPYDHSRNAEGEGQMSEGIFVREYALIDQVHNLGGFIDTFALLYPQARDVDLRTNARRLAVPVFLFQGKHEAPGRARPADEWFRMLDAPHKERAVAARSGHRPIFEQPQAFHRFMVDTVLAQSGERS